MVYVTLSNLFIIFKMLLFFLFLSFINTKKIHVSAYFAIFDEHYNETMNVSDKIPWRMFDRIIVSCTNVNTNGQLANDKIIDYPKMQKIISLYKKERLEGFADPQGSTKAFERNSLFSNGEVRNSLFSNGEVFVSMYDEREERVLHAAENPDVFSKSVDRYLKKYKLDGLDLDWETVSINTYASHLVNLSKSCFGKHKITHAVWPDIHHPKTISLLENITDQINIMSYGLSIPSIESLINSYNKYGFPYEKMVLGMETESQNENKNTIIGKLELVRKYNLSGIFIWRLDNDPDFKTTKILLDVMRNNKE